MTTRNIMLSIGLAALCGASLEAAGQEIEFSLDIGSDVALSDPVTAGGQADPGDVYTSTAAAGALVATPALDDANIFIADPPPVQGAAASAVPVHDINAAYASYFDMDGLDVIDRRVYDAGIYWQVVPQNPTLEQNFPLDCVAKAKRLVVSYDDDDAPGWRAQFFPTVPTEGPSPLGAIYGSAAGTDELVGLQVSLAGGAPTLLGIVPFASETDVHVDLNPDPGGDIYDDDIDALDLPREDACDVTYFTADHEGRLGLATDTIYQVTAGAPLQAIGPQHLAIQTHTDIDAFEFAWYPTSQGAALVVLFSVDQDDPVTPGVDESGGLDASSIYGSFMTGSHFTFLDGQMNNFDDIDAIAIK